MSKGALTVFKLEVIVLLLEIALIEAVFDLLLVKVFTIILPIAIACAVAHI